MHRFLELAKDVYAFVQPALVWYSSAGVIVGDRDVVVVDSLTNESMATALLDEIRRVTDRPVRLLINTHAHPDHIYTNHLFAQATVLCSERGRDKTLEYRSTQAAHDEVFSRLFPDVDFTGGRYTPQDVTFSGAMSIHQGGREIRLLELGPGHSESDVAVHLPGEGITFCGDLFMNGLPPMPGEGHLTETIASMRALEELGAKTYVAGHGEPGALKDLAAQRALLEFLAEEGRRRFDRGMSYDEAMDSFPDAKTPREYVRPVVLSGYCEWSGKMPGSRLPADVNHMEVMGRVARLAREATDPAL